MRLRPMRRGANDPPSARAVVAGMSNKSLDDYADELAEFKRRVAALLREIEFSGRDGCPECDRPGFDEHLAGCSLKALLREAERG